MTEYAYDEVDKIRELFVGKKITSVYIDKDESQSSYYSDTIGVVTLSDGTILHLYGNGGGCSCGAGDYTLTELNDCDNIITNVEVEANPIGDDDNNYIEDGGYYKIFVYAENKRINLATFEGDDGSGYYGTGFWINVIKPKVE